MKLLDNLVLAWRTVRANKLRTGITVAIIAFGIMALVGIITAIEAMNSSLRDSFSTMGANAFSIRFKERRMFRNDGANVTQSNTKTNRKVKKSNTGKIITYKQATLFKQMYDFPADVSIGINGPRNQVVNFDNKKTNPTVSLNGGDENYLQLNGYEIAYGRNFNRNDVQSGKDICIIGRDVAFKLFGSKLDRALDQVIRVGNNKYRVIGVTKEKGSSAFLQADNVIFATYTNVRQRYANPNQSYSIAVMVKDMNQMETAIGEAESAFRPIRGLEVSEDNNFYVDKSDSIAETFIKLLGTISAAAGAIGFITLIGAAIGLMNIMLVSVTERTREIGLRLAVGARGKDILSQFLVEAITLSTIGGILGILLGALGTWLVAELAAWPVQLSVLSIVLAVGFSAVIGIFFGYYPARKASSMQPIQALRYE
jgi:putative ABC transport system permease protein